MIIERVVADYINNEFYMILDGNKKELTKNEYYNIMHKYLGDK